MRLENEHLIRSAQDPPQPVIVLGAARSGTKLLRSIVAAAEEYAEVPQDVNYLWRHANRRRPDDRIPESEASDETRRFLAKHLRRMAALTTNDPRGYVEKTVSNTLRVPYVNALFPNARFIHLVRDGLEVTGSAMRCWQAPPEYGRLWKKARMLPWSACGGYAIDYARKLVDQRLFRRGLSPSWGPRYPGIDTDVQALTLAQVCAKQWRACVEHTLQSRASIDAERWLDVRYEALTANPTLVAQQIASFLRIRDSATVVTYASEAIRPRATRRQLTHADLASVEPILRDLRARLGYQQAVAA